MCNNIHKFGAKCTSNMKYDLFDGEVSSDSTECSFIESLRFGTYNEKGEIYVNNAEYTEREVTDSQKIGLIAVSAFCVILGIYSCYLHHAITNLLIQSLSQSQLLPPSRHRAPRGGSRRSSKKSPDDWDHSVSTYA